MRHFRPNFLHGHTECAKSRKLMAGIWVGLRLLFILFFYSWNLVPLKCLLFSYCAYYSHNIRSWEQQLFDPLLFLCVRMDTSAKKTRTSVQCMHVLWQYIATEDIVKQRDTYRDKTLQWWYLQVLWRELVTLVHSNEEYLPNQQMTQYCVAYVVLHASRNTTLLMSLIKSTQ